jgi:menaquinone-dependent protoporphyrinogen IX oxidase
MSRKALIIYGTRFGATAGTSEEIAKVLRGEGIDARVVNAKKEKISNISEYDLVIVGSGMMINRWTGEPEKFLQKFQQELSKKKVALFVSSGAQAIIEHEGKYEGFHFGGKETVLLGAEAIGRARKKYLEEKAAKYNLQPIALGLFGGIYDYNHMPWWSGKAMEAAKPKLEAAGFNEVKTGVYDTRDWNAIRSWAKGLVA